MKIVIFGGSNEALYIARDLALNTGNCYTGEAQIIVIGDKDENTVLRNPLISSLPNVEYHDRTSGYVLISKEIENPDVVIYAEREKDPLFAPIVNTKQNAQFILLSSDTVYASGVDKKENESATFMDGVYGANEEYLRNHHTKFVILRTAIVTGPGIESPLTEMITDMLASKEVVVPKRAKMDFLYIDNLLEAIRTVITKKKEKEIYNIGNGSPVDLVVLARTIGIITSKDRKEALSGATRGNIIVDRKWEMNTLVMNYEKTKNELGFDPSTPMVKGLEAEIRHVARAMVEIGDMKREEAERIIGFI